MTATESNNAATSGQYVYAEPGANHIIDLEIDGRSQCRKETLEQIRARYPNAQRVPFDQWLREKAERQHTPIQWSETTEENYEQALCVLPPAHRQGGGFLLGEPSTHSARDGAPMYAAYVRRDGKHYIANRALTVREFMRIVADNSFVIVGKNEVTT
jgi:hypothetical protein